MTDHLVTQLTRELGVRASDMTSDLTLAPRVLERARVVRRRRTAALSAGVAVAAVAAITFGAIGGNLRGAHGPTPPPATRTTQPPPAGGEPTIGYVVNGGPDREHLTAPGVVHLSGRTVSLPRGWFVQRMIASGRGLLLDVAYGDGNQHSVYVGAGGAVTPLLAVAPGPMALSRDGSTVVDTLAIELSGEVRFQSVPSGPSAGPYAGPPAGTAIPLGAVGARSVLVADPQDHLIVWTAPDSGAGPATSVQLPISPAIGRVTSTDQSGAVVLETGDGILLRHIDSKAGWTFASAPPDHIQYPPQFSPDGSRIAAVADRRLLVLPVSGRGAARSDVMPPAATTFHGIWWESPSSVLVGYAIAGAPRLTHLVRCSYPALRCTELTTTGNLVLPSS